MRFQIGKFFRTLRIAGCVVLAKTFGHYICSGWDGYSEFAQYRWRGKEWRIPTFNFPPYQQEES